MRLAGSRVLLTGASGGIGVEVLQRLLRSDARVVAISRTSAPVRAQLAELVQDRQLLLIDGDLNDAGFRAAAVDQAAQWMGGLDVLINAAGAADFRLLEHQAARGIEALVLLNLVAPMDLARVAVPLLMQSPRALIVNLGSIFGAIGYPGNAVYSATKFGLRGFSEALRRELADTNIDVLHIAPRATRTSLNPPAVDELNAALGNAVDPPSLVADRIMRAIRRSSHDVTLGWPERLFVRVNALLPRIVDIAIGSKLAVIKQFARRNQGME